MWAVGPVASWLGPRKINHRLWLSNAVMCVFENLDIMIRQAKNFKDAIIQDPQLEGTFALQSFSVSLLSQVLPSELLNTYFSLIEISEKTPSEM